MSLKVKNKEKLEEKSKFGIGSIVVIVLFILSIAYILANLNASKNHRLLYIFGFSYSVVPTDSMEPNIHVNDVTLIKNVDFDELELEDIIVYYNDVENIFVVHRIKGYFDDGSFKTKGDNYPNYDTIHVTEDNYVGKVVSSGKFFGLGKLINNGRLVIFIVLILLFLFFIISEFINIIKILKQKQEEDFKKEQKEKEESLYKELREQILKEEREKINAEIINQSKNEINDKE